MVIPSPPGPNGAAFRAQQLLLTDVALAGVSKIFIGTVVESPFVHQTFEKLSDEDRQKIVLIEETLSSSKSPLTGDERYDYMVVDQSSFVFLDEEASRFDRLSFYKEPVVHAQAERLQVKKGAGYKTACSDFYLGILGCSKGDDCPYDHDTDFTSTTWGEYIRKLKSNICFRERDDGSGSCQWSKDCYLGHK
ncbi:hypothetical protein JCM8547_006865 [Rhodosporidiobolus lusitaniae]